MQKACNEQQNEPKILSLSACLANLYVYYYELRATRGYNLTNEPQTLKTEQAVLILILLLI